MLPLNLYHGLAAAGQWGRAGRSEAESGVAEEGVPAAHPGRLEGVAHLHGAAARQLAGKPPAAATAGPRPPAGGPGAGASGAGPPADWAQRRHGRPENAATGNDDND